MIGILIITHGNLGKELIRSAELILGEQKKVKAVGLFHGDDIDEFNGKISNAIKALRKEGDDILVLVDIYGGTPSNTVILNRKDELDQDKLNFECITGVNLSMVLEAFSLRGAYSLEQLKESCIKAGADGIKDVRMNFKTITR